MKLIEMLNKDIRHIQNASIELGQAAVSLEELRGGPGHAVAQMVHTAFYAASNASIILRKVRAHLVQDGDAEIGQNVDTYV